MLKFRIPMGDSEGDPEEQPSPKKKSVLLKVGKGDDTKYSFNTGDFQFEGGVNRVPIERLRVASNTGGRIPLPDYKNPESRLNYIKQFGGKYGDFVHGRGDSIVRVNESPAWGSKSAKELATMYGKGAGIDPRLFYTSAMEEGMSGLYPDKNNMVYSSGNKDYPVSGYASFGLDNVYDRFPEFIKKGYLPADFAKNIVKRQHENEKGERVNSADFKNVDAALQAKAAYMRSAYDDVDSYAKAKGMKLSPQQRDFFALANYNSGAGNFKKMIESYNQKGYLKNDEFLKKRPDESWKQVYDNVIVRMKMADALKNEGLFE